MFYWEDTCDCVCFHQLHQLLSKRKENRWWIVKTALVERTVLFQKQFCVAKRMNVYIYIKWNLKILIHTTYLLSWMFLCAFLTPTNRATELNCLCFIGEDSKEQNVIIAMVSFLAKDPSQQGSSKWRTLICSRRDKPSGLVRRTENLHVQENWHSKKEHVSWEARIYCSYHWESRGHSQTMSLLIFRGRY